MGKPASRVGDRHDCPKKSGRKRHIGGPVTAGCDTVLINGKPAARATDPTLCVGVGAIDPIKQGEPSVLIGGKPAARKGDRTEHGGVLVEGSPTVLIGADDGCADGSCKNAQGVGSPVNPLLGIKVLPPETDIDLPSPLGWRWFRFYSSDEARVGPLGPGWNHPASLVLTIGLDTVLTDTQGRNITFNGVLAAGETRVSRSEGLWLARGGATTAPDGPWLGLAPRDWRDARRYFLTDGAGQFYVFHQPGGNKDEPPAGRFVLESQRNRLGTIASYEWRGARLDTVIDSAGRLYRFHHERLYPVLPHDSGERLTHISLELDPAGGLPRHTLVRYYYSAVGDLIEVRDRFERVQRRFAWRAHLMVAHGGPGRRTVRYEYEQVQASASDGAAPTLTPVPRVIRQVQDNGLTYTFAYHPEHTEVTDSLGRTERYWHAGEAGLKRLVRHDRADGSVLLHRYDRFGRRLASYAARVALAELQSDELTAPERHPQRYHITRYQRDTAGRLTVTDAAGLIQRHAWSPLGLLAAHTDADGATTGYAHDPLGRLITVTGPDGHATQFCYDDPSDAPPAARPARICDARGGIKQLVFDACGQLTAHTDCSGHTTRYRHDGRGQLLSVEDAAGGRTRLQYDRHDRLASAEDAAGHITRYAFDEADRLISIEDAGGRVHRQRFDAAGRLAAQIPHGGAPLQYSYDAADRLITLTTPNGATHQLGYDALDRLVTETTPDGRTLRYRYDALGQLIARDDAGLTLRHDYDEAGRLISRFLPATAAIPASLHRYVWRGTRLVEAHDGLLSLYFEHDAAGRITRETLRPAGDPPAEIPTGPEALTRSLAHHYGPLGERTRTELPNGLTQAQLSYGSAHVHQISLGEHILADYEHDPLYRPRRIHLGGHGGPVEALAFGPRGELREASLHLPSPDADTLAAPIRHQHYRYDTLGRLVSRDTPEGRHTYRYDGLDRLVGEQGGRHGATYRFDPAGNRLTVPGTRPATPSAEDWAATVRANLHNPDFNPLGEAAPRPLPEAPATSCPDNRLQNLDGVRYRHDARGNLTERRSADGQRLTLGYDALDRLIRADRHAHGQHLLTAIYTYDVFGRRRAKFVYLVETPDAPPRLRQHARYDWDGERMIGERLLTRHPDARADLGDANAWAHTERLYAYHPGTFTPLAQITCHPHNNGRVTIERIDWCHTDQIGTPHALIDKTGQNTWRIELDAWGKRLDAPPQPETPELGFTGATDPADCPIRLPGQFFDAETGLHYNRHRYYDPHAGRYVTQDPIGLYGGPNSYIYPVNPGDDIDPLGLQATGGRRNPRNGRWQPNGPKKPIPDPTKTENPTEIMKGKNDTASDIPDALRGVACIFNSEYCIPSDSFQCNRAEKKLSDGSKHIIDYLDNSVPALKDPGELYPPMASQLPNGYVCTEIGIRTHLPYRTTPPGL